jgi:UDP-N-acetyl-D-glucosamine dehydrogenase
MTDTSRFGRCADEIARRIDKRSAVVGVVGQGYVGFPLAQRVAACGLRVLGYDIDPAALARCSLENASPLYSAAVAPADLRVCDVVIVAVPTPTRPASGGGYEPDLQPVLQATRTLLDTVLCDGRPRLLIYESSYAPGTTRGLIAPLLAERHLLGCDLWLGYSPERIDPGNSRFTLAGTPKLTSGYDADSAALTQRFYAAIVDRPVAASSLEAAEAAKMWENVFRFINIAAAQEFDGYCARAGLNAREISALAATKPFGFMRFDAGAGIGGHCIAEDPYFLYEEMRARGAPAAILGAALANHEQRGAEIAGRIRAALPAGTARGRRILLLGITYKPEVADTRRSQALPILTLLEGEGAIVDYHDPLVPEFAGRRSVDIAAAQPDDYDLAVVLTPHSAIDLTTLAANGWRLYDTRDSRPTVDRQEPPQRMQQPASDALAAAL